MALLLYTVGILVLITLTSQSPHIFGNKETCEIFTKIGKKSKRYVVPAKIKAENEEMRVNIQLCTKDDYVPGGQTAFPKISLYNKTSSITKNNSDLQTYEVSEEQEDVIISLVNDIECTDILNYRVTVRLLKSNLKRPRINLDNECEIEIEIPNPEYDPACKKFVEGKWFIDLTPLRGRTFTVNNDKGEMYHVSLCGPAPGCNSQAGCKIGGNEPTIIGSLKTQRVQFESGTNAVTVVSSIKEGRSTKNMLVSLRCNWNVPYISSPKLLNEGRNFKFEVQSSFGCVKLPKSCIIRENGHQKLFDLRNLSNKDGTVVANTKTPIRLNICDNLQISGARNNRCNAEKSQVCEIQGNVYLNRGSIPYFEVKDGNIRVTFRDGHSCNINGTYSTIVDLKCSSIEKGPVYVSQENCLTKISWETPQACPILQMEEKSCAFYSSMGNVDLTELYRSSGFTKVLSTNKKLVYNICGKVGINCSTSDQVSACLIDGNQQRIVGWNKPSLSYTNGELQLKYTGERCGTKNKPYSLTINMVCSFVEKQVEPEMSNVDDCTFTATVSTISACLKPWEIKECTIEEENYKYDLNPLIRRDTNYEIKDGKIRDRTYFLNLCAPVIPKENLIFRANSMMYLRNSSAASITDKFTLLGQVTKPFVQDGKILVKLVGSTWKPGVQYSSKIYLECSSNEESPTILNTTGCSLEFRWRTRHACPIMKHGGKCSLTDGSAKAEVPGDPIVIKVDNFNTYHFSLCLEHYRWCTNNGSCVTKKLLSKRIRAENGIFYVELKLDNSTRSLLKTANLKVECDPYTFLNSSKGPSRNPEHLELNVKTRISCDKEIQKVYRDAPSPPSEHKKELEVESANTVAETPIVQNKEHKVESVDKVEETWKYETIKKSDEEVKDDNQNSKISDIEIPKKKPLLLTSETAKEIEENKASHLTETSSKQTPKDRTYVKPINLSGKDPDTKEGKPTVATNTIPNRRCDITVSGKTLKMKELVSKEFRSPNATYILNFDGKSSKCGGLICRNGGNILNFIEDCPKISYGEDYINLNYFNAESTHIIHAANSSGSTVGKEIEVSLRCNHAEITANVSETNNRINLQYSSPKICVLSESSNNSVFIFVIVVVFVLLILCCICYVLYRKSFFRKCTYDRVSEEASMVVHSKLL